MIDRSRPPQIVDLNDPRRVEAPSSFAPTPRKQYSAAAAAAAQQWEELEQDLNYTKDQLQHAHAQVLTLEESSKLIREEIKQVRAENERLVRENTTIHSRLRAAADVLVGLLQVQPLPEETQSAVERELSKALNVSPRPEHEAE